MVYGLIEQCLDRSSHWVVTLGLPDLGLVDKDPVSLNLCKLRCTAPFETLYFIYNFTLWHAFIIIWPLIPSPMSVCVDISKSRYVVNYK